MRDHMHGELLWIVSACVIQLIAFIFCTWCLHFLYYMHYIHWEDATYSLDVCHTNVQGSPYSKFTFGKINFVLLVWISSPT